MEELIKQLTEGGANIWLILIVAAVFLFKDKIFPPKPATPATPAPPAPTPDPNAPPSPVPVAPSERPIVDAIIKLLPVILPVILDTIKKQEREAAEKAK